VKDQLCRDLSVREVDYSYEIDASSMIYEEHGVVGHAQKLIDEYAAVRRKLDEVIIAFSCNSRFWLLARGYRWLMLSGGSLK
jgi:hypothetical protein